MINLNEEIDNSIDDFDEEDGRQAYLAFFKDSFPFLLCPTLSYFVLLCTDEVMTFLY
ncbi:hypothetical protein HZM71_004037 [Salmonella enterica]|nr:hypothetical protein [Salmonella enterica]EJB1335877.1 hypothetical protein [Salmonella enterica]